MESKSGTQHSAQSAHKSAPILSSHGRVGATVDVGAAVVGADVGATVVGADVGATVVGAGVGVLVSPGSVGATVVGALVGATVVGALVGALVGAVVTEQVPQVSLHVSFAPSTEEQRLGFFSNHPQPFVSISFFQVSSNLNFTVESTQVPHVPHVSGQWVETPGILQRVSVSFLATHLQNGLM